MRKHGILFQKKGGEKNKGALVQKSGVFVHGKLFKNVISKVNIILSMLKRI
jgi:hypothetical protein